MPQPIADVHRRRPPTQLNGDCVQTVTFLQRWSDRRQGLFGMQNSAAHPSRGPKPEIALGSPQTDPLERAEVKTRNRGCGGEKACVKSLGDNKT